MLITGTPRRLVNGLGVLESPVIRGSDSCVFSDVAGGGIYSLKGENLTTLVPYRKGIGGIAFCADGSLIVTGRNVSRKWPGEKTGEILCDADVDGGVSSYNDVAVDSAGRIYVGALNLKPPTPTGTAYPTSLLLVDNEGTSRVVASDFLFPNGMAFTAQGARLLVVDSDRRCIFSFRVGTYGILDDRRVFAEWPGDTPDGLAVAEDGTVWVAVTGPAGGFVDVLDVAGASRERLTFDEPLVTNVALGFADAPRLLVTTGSSPDRPGCGCLYEVEVRVAGVPLHPARLRTGHD